MPVMSELLLHHGKRLPLTNNIEPHFQAYFKICHPRERDNPTKFGDQIKKENNDHTLQNMSVTIRELLLYHLFTID